MKKDILICGVGGQGTVLSSKIIASAAMEEGNTVHSAETIGMAQRGGSVTSHVRLGEDSYSPLIPENSADLMLAFEPAEAARNLGYLKKDGIVIVNRTPVRPVSQPAGDAVYDGSEIVKYLEENCDCFVVDSEELCAPFGSARFFNIMILGIASGRGVLGLKKETLLSEIEKRVPARYAEVNKKAFLSGCETGSEASGKRRKDEDK